MNLAKGKQIIESAHQTLNTGRISSFLDFITDDFVYESNAGPAGRGPVGLVGKAEFLHFWEPVFAVVNTHTVPEKITINGSLLRVQLSAVITHKETGAKLEESYRQIITFRDAKFSRISEYHDPGKMNAFCRMVMTA
jgi:ketosteroid isomerase-like protein